MRNEIIEILLEDKKTKEEICEEIGESEDIVTHVLNELEKNGFINYTSENNSIFWYSTIKQ